MRLVLALAALALASSAQAAPITESQVRDLIGRQQQTWNAGQLSAYFATFSPKAVFTDQARTQAGKLVPYGKSSRAEAQTQARKFRARGTVAEAGQVLSIHIAPGGASAGAVSTVISKITEKERLRTTCAERVQGFVQSGGRLMTVLQIDTLVRCPR